MKRLSLWLILLCSGIASTTWGQCISDDCGDIVARFILEGNQTVVCEGTPFEINNLTTEDNIDYYILDWGDGVRDTVQNTNNVSHTYKESDDEACLTGSTFYEITLEIYRSCGDLQSCHFQRTGVLVKYRPRVEFTAGNACQGEEVEFGVEICNADSVHWDFGDGTTSSEESPAHVYTEPGTYWAVVEVFNDCDMAVDSGLITVTEGPQASIALDPATKDGCVPHILPVVNNTIQPLNYNWSVAPAAGVSFINGTDSLSPEPEIFFENPGTYVLNLGTSNLCGEASWSDTIIVFDTPRGAVDDPGPLCGSSTFTPSASYIDRGRIDAVSWTFINGAPAMASGFDPGPVRFDVSGTILLTTDSECGVVTDTFEVIIGDPTNLQLQAPTEPLCTASDPVRLTASPTGGLWSGPAIDTSGRFDPAAAGPGMHTITYSLADACATQASVSLEVLAAADIQVEDQVAVCSTADPYTLSFNPTGGTWSGPGVVDINLGIFDPAQSGPGSFELNYAYADDAGCVVSRTTAVDVQPVPQIGAPDTAFSCAYPGQIQLLPDAQLNLEPGGGSLRWSGPGVVDSSGIFDADQAGAAGFGTYPITVEYTLDQCTVSDSLQLMVMPPPPARAGDDRRVCVTDGQILLTAQPLGGYFQGPGVDSSGLVDLTLAGGGQQTYIYNYREGTSCAASDTVRVDVIDNSGVAAGQDQTICERSPAFDLSEAGLTGGTWTGPGIIDPSVGRIDPVGLTAGTYQYVFTLADSTIGCAASDTMDLRVEPLPSALFAPSENPCVNIPLTFRNVFRGGQTYRWDFGDGTQAEGQNPQHEFAIEGQYTISLEVTSEVGCVNRREQPIRISSPPILAFVPDQNDGCAPLTVNFTNASTGSDLRFEWDFGNGRVSNEEGPPPIVYEQGLGDTTFVVRMRAYNACGDEQLFDTIQLRAVPIADFGTNVDDGCAPLDISFANTSTGSPDTYQWDLGNGMFTTDSLPSAQVYANTTDEPVRYPISLYITNECGEDWAYDTILVNPRNVRAFIGLDTSRGCQPFTVPFENFATPGARVRWEFGDGGTSIAADAVHTFDTAGTFTVRQIADNGCSTDTTEANIVVLPPPEVAMEVPNTACIGEVVRFTNRSPRAAVTEWDFGDGSTSNVLSPEHVYDSAGTFTVRLLIFSADNGCPAEDSTTITILPKPEAGLAADATAGCPPLRVCFTNLSQNAQLYDWDFGDGNGSTDVAPCHTFTEPGRHRVRLRGVDPNGCFSDTAAVDVLVYEAPTAAVAPIEPLNCGLPDAVQMLNNSEGARDYRWILSDGQLSDLTNPEFTFTTEGTVEIQLVVSNAFGCTDTAVSERTSLPLPEIDFDPPEITGCAPVTVTFNNYTENADSYEWFFGNRETSTEFEPVLVFDRAGVYSARLIAGYQGLCFDTLDRSNVVEILPSPDAAFNWTELPAERGLVTFTNLSTNADGYEWDFGDGSFSTEESPTHRYTTNALDERGWEVLLYAFNGNGCVDTARTEVGPELFFALHFPNAFSPEHGRGDVRYFRPAGIGIEEWTLQIYTPWGELVWESQELEGDQPAAAWDGRHRRTGKILPQGGYAYQASVLFRNGLRKYYKGSVTLLR